MALGQRCGFVDNNGVGRRVERAKSLDQYVKVVPFESGEVESQVSYAFHLPKQDIRSDVRFSAPDEKIRCLKRVTTLLRRVDAKIRK